MKRRTRFTCIVDADESTRPRQGAVHISHQDHITAKRVNSVTQYSLLHKFIPMPQAMKIPDAKAAVVKEKGKIGDKSCMAADKSQKQEKCDR